MPEGGEDLREHLSMKYGTTKEQSIAVRQGLMDIGESLGFTFNYFDSMRVYNTFKAHQLLFWAREHGKEHELKMNLFSAFFSESKVIDDLEVLLQLAEQTGLNPKEARIVLEDETFGSAVKKEEMEWVNQGIHAVPAFILNKKHLISGAQEPETFIQAFQN